MKNISYAIACCFLAWYAGIGMVSTWKPIQDISYVNSFNNTNCNIRVTHSLLMEHEHQIEGSKQ